MDDTFLKVLVSVAILIVLFVFLSVRSSDCKEQGGRLVQGVFGYECVAAPPLRKP